jgi:hypothetical protein
MPHPIIQAQPPLEFLPSAFNPWLLRFFHLVLPMWMRSQTPVADIQATNVEVLVELYRQFEAGKIRFLIAFRHPSAYDGLSLVYLLSQLVPQAAKKQGISLSQPPHAHFIYDRGIPIWAGAYANWLFPRLGGTPIQRGKLDLIGLRSIRHLFANGSLPMAAAPEGGTNAHNEIISPLEPGIAQMGFWCLEDLQKAGRTEKVIILPLGIQYRYLGEPWQAIEHLLAELELDCGLPPLEANPGDFVRSSDAWKNQLYRRLYRLGDRLLSLMENFYTRFYHQTLTPVPTETADSPNATTSARLQALLHAALLVAEQALGVASKGTVIDRCRRLEQAGWEFIYREDLKKLESLSPAERGLADLMAEEASLKMWHMRLVESFVAVTGSYVLEKPTVERFAETVLIMWDTIVRIKGDNPFQRPQLGKQQVQLTVGEPISVSERWETYQSSRRNAKQAVADLTQDLQTSLQSMIF